MNTKPRTWSRRALALACVTVAVFVFGFAPQLTAQSVNWVDSGADVYTTGRVAIGTPTMNGMLHVYRSVNGFTDVAIMNDNLGSAANTRYRMGQNANLGQSFFFQYFNSGYVGSGLVTANRAFFGAASGASNGLVVATLGSAPILFATGGAGTANERVRIDGSGVVTIGTNPGDQSDKLVVNGRIMATSVIGSVYQDLAEWVPASEPMAPATVVVIDAEAVNGVTPSIQAYDTAVAGVISAQPGLLLGVEGPSKAMVATTGRVKVRVDASYGAIRTGDLLVTSGRRGVAMRSAPLDVGGIIIHRPGTIIGKALEPLLSGEGEILVLLSLQ
jgi:hypothetical protein